MSTYEDAKSTVSDDVAGDDAVGSSDEDYGYDITDSDHDDDDTVGQIDPFLYKDMENLILVYGENALKYRLFESIDQIDVELHIPVGFLEEEIAVAWKVNRLEPLVVRLHLSMSQYIHSSATPKVEVFQSSMKGSFGFGTQVRKFLETFLLEHWRTLPEKYGECMRNEDMLTKSETFPVTPRPTERGPEHSFEVSDEYIAKLVEAGFDAVLSRNALIITHGDIEAAMTLMLNNPTTCAVEPVCPSFFKNMKNSETGDALTETKAATDDNLDQSETSSPANPVAGKLSRQTSHPPPFFNRLKKMLPNLTRTTSMLPENDLSCTHEDLNLVDPSTLDGKNAKKVPSLTNGFLVQIFRYVRQRIPTMNEYCVICDQPHVFQNGAMLKPAVCARELCVFAFQTLGVMADAAEDIATGAEVVDLLINLTKFACRSSRKELIFDPYPTIVHPSNPNTLLFTPDRKKFDEVKAVLDDIPSMQEMATLTVALKQKLDDNNKAIYPMIQWIITSNR